MDDDGGGRGTTLLAVVTTGGSSLDARVMQDSASQWRACEASRLLTLGSKRVRCHCPSSSLPLSSCVPTSAAETDAAFVWTCLSGATLFAAAARRPTTTLTQLETELLGQDVLKTLLVRAPRGCTAFPSPELSPRSSLSHHLRCAISNYCVGLSGAESP